MSNEIKNKLFTSTDCISEQTMFDYIDNKLSPKEQHLVEKHMLDCDLCSDALEGLKLLKDRKRIKIVNQLIREKASGNQNKIIGINYKILVSIAAGILLLTGGVFFFRYSSDRLMESKNIADLKVPAEKEAPSEEDVRTLPDSILPEPTPSEERPISKNENNKGKSKTEDYETDKLREDDTGTNLMGAGSSVATGEKMVSQKQIAQDEDLKNIPESKVTADEIVTLDYKSLEKDEPAKTDEGKDKLTAKEEENQDEQGYYAKEQAATKSSGKNRSINTENKKKQTKREETKPESSGNITYTPQAPEKSPSSEKLKRNTLENADTNFETSVISDKLDKAEIVLALVDEMPQYPGGETEMRKFINSNLNYSKFSQDSTLLNTKVYVQFTVNSEGGIENPKITKGINSIIDTEVIRVIKLMPKWKPGKKDGNNVPVLFNLPIQLDFK